MGIAVLLHVVAVVIWVGGMFFAYMALRPVAADQLEPPQRLRLWAGVFARFFPWVWVAVMVILVTGLWMVFAVFGGVGPSGLHIDLMLIAGIAMMLIFFHVFFAPYRRLHRAVVAEDWPAGGRALGQIRMLIGINLVLGLVTVAIASGGRFLLV